MRRTKRSIPGRGIGCRALVGGHLLRQLHPAVRLGVAATGDELLAHAWLEIDGRPLEAVEHFARFERTPSAGSGP